jgi:hypothetical protein
MLKEVTINYEKGFKLEIHITRRGKKMMTKTNKIFLMVGILLGIFGFFIWAILNIIILGGFLFVIGGILIFISLIVQKKYKGSKI